MDPQPPQPLGPVYIGAREIYDQVMKLSGQVAALSQQITDQTVRTADHETRLRSLERGRWPLPSVSILVAIGALVLAFVR